MTLKFTYIEKG